jgi:hypothetical protein
LSSPAEEAGMCSALICAIVWIVPKSSIGLLRVKVNVITIGNFLFAVAKT